jgi:transcriptional regulator with XRE-family HTH domain
MSTIHSRLRELRDEERLSERQFAERVSAAGRTGWKVTNTSTRNYELGGSGGSAKVPSDYVAAVCKAFNVRVEWLVLGEEPKRAQPVEAEVEGFRRMVAIADEIRARGRADASKRAKAEAAATGEVGADAAPPTRPKAKTKRRTRGG